MNNIVENVIATIIVTCMSTTAGLALQAGGLGPQQSIGAATAILCALVILFLTTRKYYPIYLRRVTEDLLEKALRVNMEIDAASGAFKKKIIERVLLENHGIELKQNSTVTEHKNQVACESNICEAFRAAKRIKILTIRGEKYFLGSRSLLYNLYLEKQIRSFSIEVMVLSPESQHITESQAKDIGHRSVEEIRRKMRIALDYLKHIAESDQQFEVKCYDEKPNFKILIFDDIMFVSSFAGGGPKNDRNAKMFRITREGNPLFSGFERYFDELWNKANSPN